jgi:hypothetical protein
MHDAWLAASWFVVRNDSRERSYCAVVVAPPLHFVGRSTRLRARRADEALSLSVGCSYELGKYHGTLSRGLDSHVGGRRGQCFILVLSEGVASLWGEVNKCVQHP